MTECERKKSDKTSGDEMLHWKIPIKLKRVNHDYYTRYAECLQPVEYFREANLQLPPSQYTKLYYNYKVLWLILGGLSIGGVFVSSYPLLCRILYG